MRLPEVAEEWRRQSSECLVSMDLIRRNNLKAAHQARLVVLARPLLRAALPRVVVLAHLQQVGRHRVEDLVRRQVARRQGAASAAVNPKAAVSVRHQARANPLREAASAADSLREAASAAAERRRAAAASVEEEHHQAAAASVRRRTRAAGSLREAASAAASAAVGRLRAADSLWAAASARPVAELRRQPWALRPPRKRRVAAARSS